MPFKSTVGDYQTVATLETFGFLPPFTQDEIDRKSTRLNSSHVALSRMPSSA